MLGFEDKKEVKIADNGGTGQREGGGGRGGGGGGI